MITSIRLSDFLSFKDTVIDFDKGITVLVGESFAGKSNILRAIEEILIAPGTGDSIRANTKTAYIIADIYDCTIERVKGKGGNSYSIGDTEFNKVGRNLPDELKELVNLAWLDKCCISISSQSGKRFLLDETSSSAAKYLATISGLDQLLRAIELADKKNKDMKSEIKFKENEIIELKNDQQESKKKLKHIKPVKKLGLIQRKIDKLEKRINKRETLLVQQINFKKLKTTYAKKLKHINQEIKNMIQKMDICPLSGGELFQECRERILDV